MTDGKLAKAYEKSAEEKLTPTIFYTQNMFIKGEAVTKENIRVSTWLRTAAAPEFVHLFNAQLLIFGAGAMQTASYQEFLIPTPQIIAYHMVPPAKDPLDYDEAELNRKMEPCTVMVGTFRLHGHARMASQLDLGKNLEVNRSAFLSLYEVEVSNPALPNMGVMHVPILLARPNMILFGLQTS
jgi:hypothetical protein